MHTPEVENFLKAINRWLKTQGNKRQKTFSLDVKYTADTKYATIEFWQKEVASGKTTLMTKNEFIPNEYLQIKATGMNMVGVDEEDYELFS